MNPYFDGYVHSNTMFNEFVVQHDKILIVQREAEEKQDFQTIKIQASLSGSHGVERTTEAYYTRRVFRKF